MAQRSFKLTDELDARLVAEAERQGRSVSNLIVWAVTRLVVSPGYFPKAEALEEALGAGQGLPGRVEGERSGEPTRAASKSSTPTSLRAPDDSVGTPLPKIAPRRQPR